MKTTVVITVQGDVSLMDISDYSLERLQEAVEGYVQAIDLSDELTIWCNEEGKMLNLCHNPYGQAFWEKSYGRTDYIVGNIVLTGGTDSEGETLGLTDEQILKINETIAEVALFVNPRIEVL